MIVVNEGRLDGKKNQMAWHEDFRILFITNGANWNKSKASKQKLPVILLLQVHSIETNEGKVGKNI